MILHVKWDADYLVITGARILIAVKYYFRDHPINPTNPSDVNPNGPTLKEYKTSRHVVISAEES